MTIAQAQTALRQYFGYDRFRPMQTEIIEAVYARRDVVVLMPTGGGKSICFQVPALTLPGTAVVVSPLISLMKDQVEGLRANGVRAAYLNSSLDSRGQQEVEEAFFQGQLDLLYVSPEKLVSNGFIPLLQRANVALFAIDEAHCISAWGHDFRPEYTQLRFLKKQFPGIPLIALTATADRLTRQDIISQLGLAAPAVFIASFDRPNLSLEVRPGQRRREQILQFLKRHPHQSGIVYCLSRRSTEELAARLNDAGYRAAAYHAGLADEERARVQEAFSNDQTPIICATIAFGMGIDKSNVRWIIHYNLPKNLENYYQEIGRAGRDGAPAETILFYSYQDVMVLTDIIIGNAGQNGAVQLAKLERMQQYAESTTCRRRILLNYFNENLTENCGNCDVCRNPPKSFDGTTIAQKALSAVYRLRENGSMGLLIDVLRGSAKREILEKGYDQLKTYGVGRDIPPGEWQNYLYQLLDQGYLELAHDRHNALALTPASQRVLFEGEKVQLVRLATVRERQQTEKELAKEQAAKRERVRDDLFEHLRQLRSRLAREQGLPPYLIFSDATLEEMAASKPADAVEFKAVSGVGQKKLEQYGEVFLEAIQGFLEQQGQISPNSAHRLTFDLFLQGLSPEEIALKREMQLTTIYGHLAICYENGSPLDLSKLMPLNSIERVQSCLRYLREGYGVKDVYEYLGGEVPHHHIRLALAHLRRTEKAG